MGGFRMKKITRLIACVLMILAMILTGFSGSAFIAVQVYAATDGEETQDNELLDTASDDEYPETLMESVSTDGSEDIIILDGSGDDMPEEAGEEAGSDQPDELLGNDGTYCELIFDYCDGQTTQGYEVEKGSVITQLPYIPREGYEFDGWFTEETGGEQIFDNLTVNESVTYYAHWTKLCRVTFNFCNGKPNEYRNVRQGGKLSRIPAPSGPGLYFDGWYTEKEGKGTKITSDVRINEDIMVFAHWLPECKVTFEYGDGRQSVTRPAGFGIAIGELEEPSREDFYFRGWFTEETGGRKIGPEEVITGSVTFYARWEEIVYRTVTFDPAGGRYTEPRRVPTGTAIGSLPGCYRSRYAFIGWFTASDDGRQIDASEVINEDVTFYARWEAIPYCTVSFDANGGETVESKMIPKGNMIMYYFDLPWAYRQGYSFDGWYTEREGGKLVGEKTVITEDTTFFAHWVKYEGSAPQVRRINGAGQRLPYGSGGSLSVDAAAAEGYTLSYQWLISIIDDPLISAPYVDIDGATDAVLTIPDDMPVLDLGFKDIIPYSYVCKVTSTCDADGSSETVYSWTASVWIEKKPVEVTAADQIIGPEAEIDNSVSKAVLSGALNGHVLSDVSFTSGEYEGLPNQSSIVPGDAKITCDGKDVTANYEITYVPGVLTRKGNQWIGAALPLLKDPTYEVRVLIYSGRSSEFEYTVTEGKDSLLPEQPSWTDLPELNNRSFVPPGLKAGTTYKVWLRKKETPMKIASEPASGLITTPENCMVIFDLKGHGNGIAPLTPVPGERVLRPDDPKAEGLVFDGWFMDEGCKIPYDFSEPVMGSLILYALWSEPGRIWYAAVPVQTYTGSAIKPDIDVWFKDKLLKEKTDYTINFSNNTDAGKAEFVITCKGNCSGTVKGSFRIMQKNIGDPDVDVSGIASAVQNPNKAYKPVPVITYNRKKLAAGADFTVEYFKDNGSSEPCEPKEDGKYRAEISGVDNFTGSVTVPFVILSDEQVSVSKFTVAKIPDQKYAEGREVRPGVSVKYKGQTVASEKYDLTYADNTEVGTATVTITGKETKGCFGTKTVTFKITGTALSKAKVSTAGFVKAYTYDGTEKKNELTLTDAASGKVLTGMEKSVYDALTDLKKKRSADYVITYENNINAGTAAMILTGVNGMVGTVKKTYTINRFDIKKDNDENDFTVSLTGGPYEYKKAGVKPKPEVRFNGTLLTEGADYTLTYSNNSAIGGKKEPTVKVTGKGSFTGSAEKTFGIVKAGMKEAGIRISAKDVLYSNRAGNWKTAVTVTDPDGRKLTEKTDCTLEFFTRDETGDKAIGKTDKLLPGTTVYVKATAADGEKSCYSGYVTGTYRIYANDIGKLTASVKNQEYTGRPVTISSEDIVWKSGKNPVEDVTFVFDWNSYEKNVNKGTASVTVHGTGEYGGTKKLSFKIDTKQIGQ